MLTDNRVLVDNLRELPTLMCIQRKAAKRVVTEEDSIRANIDSFGSEIGSTTNHITAMFDALPLFEEGSKEYEALQYRIKCGQLFQQNAIDKAKGIIAKPMPREWFDWHAVNQIEDDEAREFYSRIVADRKPYFMRYIYPDLMKQYNTYVKNTTKNALREFGITTDEMKELPQSELTERQSEFLEYYDARLPVSNNDCVMNRICRMFEEKFDGYIGKRKAADSFDYTIMKSGVEYPQSAYNEIMKLYKNYNAKLRSFAIFSKYERVDKDEANAQMSDMCDEFMRECEAVCSSREVLCDILLDICYSRSSTKSFVWDLCADQIIANLLKKNNYTMQYPVADPDGNIHYAGCTFSVHQKEIQGVNL